jgi:hypothetical protein
MWNLLDKWARSDAITAITGPPGEHGVSGGDVVIAVSFIGSVSTDASITPI